MTTKDTTSGGFFKGFVEYSGMSYEQASREGERLVERHGWYQSLDRLLALRIIMQSRLKVIDGDGFVGVAPQ